MYILGISAFYHDSAACLVKNGEILAAAQEERFSRKKHDFRFPHAAISYCLDEARIGINDVEYIVFYEEPYLKLDRILQTYIAVAPSGFRVYMNSLNSWITKKIWIRERIENSLGFKNKVVFSKHHESHAASAFFPSPFKEAAVLTIDGVGEWDTTTMGHAHESEIRLIKSLRFPHSLGLLYSAFTYYTGFKVNSGEYKVMGLAPYGEPCYVDTIRKHLVDIKEDGSFHLNMNYFGYLDGVTMTNKKFNDLFGAPPRTSESALRQKDMDLASSVQVITEEIMMKMVSYLYDQTGSDNLCLAGGVALNCVANGKVLREGPFKNIWIQPAAGDAGGAVGAALHIWHQKLKNPRTVDNLDRMKGSYLGPSYSNQRIKEFLTTENIPYREVDNANLSDNVSDLLIEGKVIGWFQGRMEFGPRALGNRSIIADARNAEMQKKMNIKIKFRESFRPFAPSVIREDLEDFFDISCDSPYMLLVANVNEKRRIKMSESQSKLFGIEKLNVLRRDIPAVTHVDYSARIQTVHKETNERYHELISKFREKTGCSVIINTSFNVRGEPIVCTPEDAYKCFMRTGIDYLVLENFILDKNEQPAFSECSDWRMEFALD